MKKVLWIMLGAALLQSCMEDVSRVEHEGPNKVEELKVPANFDWVTSKNVTLVVNTQNVSTLVKLFADKECKESLLATIGTKAGADNQTMTSVPDYLETVYALYPSASGKEKIISANVIGNTFSFNISDAQVAELKTRTPDETDPPFSENGGILGYPANHGSVFFEDLYPSLGDYDFNDVVLNYQITLEHPWVDGAYDQTKVEKMRIHLEARALGGTLPFIPYVRVVGLPAEDVSIPDNIYGVAADLNPLIYMDTKEGIEITKVNGTETTDAIFEFKNLNGTNLYKPQGATYLNTQKEYLTKASQLAEVCVFLNLEKEMLVEDLLDDKIDIFLANADRTKEIHLRGYEPVFSKYDYSASDNLSKTVTYASKNNLVWGIKTPIVIAHVVEQSDFCEGYLDFASWAQNGGTLDKAWYKGATNSDKLIKLK